MTYCIKTVHLQESVQNELHIREEGRCALENEALKLNKQNSEVFEMKAFISTYSANLRAVLVFIFQLREEIDGLQKYLLQLRNDFEKETDLLKNDLVCILKF